MIEEQYLTKLKSLIEQKIGKEPVKIFIYGSSLERDNFRDIDLGIEGQLSARQISELREYFEESTFPYQIDIIDFNQVSPDFKKEVLNNKMLWIKN